jgi:hypothetical protein
MSFGRLVPELVLVGGLNLLEVHDEIQGNHQIQLQVRHGSLEEHGLVAIHQLRFEEKPSSEPEK